ncbi:MAG: Anaerobic regulatory protein [Candidatus Accumulibacter phosphatis]|uniref:Anaerobic regulatory protein n=3 Tax=Candidatus Accumulibacter TaxID=327159 RepID=A0A080LXZ8_9PROT|nr:MAG: Anaerobic regulatory protein [Candidatus Accumulibacter phosphatis]
MKVAYATHEEKKDQMSKDAATARLAFEIVKTACSNCNLRELCLPIGLAPEELKKLDELVSARRRLKRGDYLYRAGQVFESIYAVRSGFFKTDVLIEDGRDQVTGFQMTGELLGLDGISSEIHTCNAIALEDSEVCAIPFSHLEGLSRQIHTLQHHFHKVMSREIVRDHGVMMLLGTMRAEERLAAFLLNLSQRFKARGYSPAEFNLRMSRDEIGSYLGLKLETVSRTFSHFQEEGLLAVHQRKIRILHTEGLKKLMTHQRT